MDTSSVDEPRDPEQLWSKFNGIFQSIMKAKRAEVLAFFPKFSQLFNCFPQAVTPTQSWPASNKAVHNRRHAFNINLFRRVLHLSLKGEENLSDYVGVLNSLLTVMHDYDVNYWKDMVRQILMFWTRLADINLSLANDPDKVPAEECIIFEEGFSCVDDLFDGEYNTVPVSLDFTNVETLLSVCTWMLEKQVILHDDKKMIVTIEKLCIGQLEIGEVFLKQRSLSTLTALHCKYGFLSLEQWIAESHFVSQTLKLLCSGNLLEDEVDNLSKSWTDYIDKVTVKLEEKHLKVLSLSLIPVWSELELSKLKEKTLETAEDLVALVIKYDKQAQASFISSYKDSPFSIKILSSLALLELDEKLAPLVTKKTSPKIRLYEVSQHWNLLILTLEKHCNNIPILLETFKAVTKTISHILKNFPNIEMELLRKSSLDPLTHNILVLMNQNYEKTIDLGLEALKMLSMMAFLWPGASKIGSDILSLLHTWVALLTLPWFTSQPRGMLLDLKLVYLKDAVVKCSKKAAWTEDQKSKALYLISHFPKEICPKWRFSVSKIAWTQKSGNVVVNLPALITNTGLASGLAKEVIDHVVNRAENVSMVRQLAQVSGNYVCSLAKKTVSKLVSAGSAEALMFKLLCYDCNESQVAKVVRTPSKTVTVDGSDLDPIMKLIGHQEKDVRMHLLSMLLPISRHSFLSSSAAELWITNVSDDDEEIRTFFSKNIVHMLRAKSDTLSGGVTDCTVVSRMVELVPSPESEQIETFLQTLVSLLSVDMSEQSLCRVLNVLLDSYLECADQVEITTVHAFSSLKDAIVPHHKHVVRWAAKKMCEDDQCSKTVFLHLLLLCKGKGRELETFMEGNLKIILPTIILHASKPKSRLNRGADRALEYIATTLNNKVRMLLYDNFTDIFIHMIIYSDDQSHLRRSNAYLEERCYKTLAELIPSKRLVVLAELLKMFNFNKKRITQALSMVAANDKSFNHPEKIAGKPVPVNALASYVSSHFNAILASFTTTLSLEEVNLDVKLQILTSLDDLIQFLKGDNLVSCKNSMVDVLKLGTDIAKRNGQFYDLSINLWESFVMTMHIKELLSMLPQITCFLLPLLPWARERTTTLIKHLLENSLQSGKEMPSLMFLPEIDSLEETLKKVRGGKNLQLRKLIENLLICLQDTSVDVRLQTLMTLSTVLDNNIGALQGLILRSESIDPVIGDLISSLMAAVSIQESDDKVRMFAGDCLGKIGPLDPGKLGITVNLAGAIKDIFNLDQILDIFSDEFCADLLKELVRAKLSFAEVKLSDYCAYSIQEVLKVYEINPDSRENDFSTKVLLQLPCGIMEKINPLFNSQYCHDVFTKYEISSPIYLSDRGKTYSDWLFYWSHHMVDKIKNERAKNLFEACLPSIKKSSRFAEFMLPRIVLQLVCDGDDAVIEEVLMKEINFVVEKSNVVNQSNEKHLHTSVATMIFAAMDHLGLWARAKFQVLMSETGREESSLKPEEIQRALNKCPQYLKVKKCLDGFSHDGLANLSFNVAALHRSAFHLEQFIRSNSDVPSNVSALQKLFVALKEPDLVLGVSAIREEEPDLADLIQLHQATGKYHDALSCYQIYNQDPHGQIRCYLDLNQPQTARALGEHFMKTADQQLQADLVPLQVEAAWQLEQWEDVATLSKKEVQSSSWEVNLGTVLLSLKRENWPEMRALMERTKEDLVRQLSTSSIEQGAYYRGYSLITKLGMLNDVQMISEKLIIPNSKCLSSLSKEGVSELLTELSCRLSYSQNSWNVIEPVLRLRRCCFGIARDRIKPFNPELAERLDFEIGECWIKTAKLARSLGQLQESYKVLTEAKKYKHLEAYLESAKLNWARGQEKSSICILRKGIKENFAKLEAAMGGQIVEFKDSHKNPKAMKILGSLSNRERNILIESRILLACYLDESKSVSEDDVSTIFKETKLMTKSGDGEELYFHYAWHLDKIYANVTPEQLIQHSDHFYYTCIYYLRSIHSGPKHLHHCLPRMLSKWFNFAEVLAKMSEKKGKSPFEVAKVSAASGILKKFIDNNSSWGKWLPQYFYLTALPQLVSNICHLHQDTYLLISKILTDMMSGSYSQQTFWQLVAVSKNRDKNRKEKCQKIFDDAMKISPKQQTALTNSLTFAKKIDELCEYKTEKGQRSMKLSETLKSLPAFINSDKFYSVILPNQRNLLATLPTSDGNVHQHNPFPSGLVEIEKIDDEVRLMPSMVQPKRISFKGTDGLWHMFLAKPKDDLRRDSRLMDYNCLLNKLYQKDGESRSRNLLIRTYSVIPTNETNGLIEWVDNLCGIRPIIHQLHKEEGRTLNMSWSQQFQPAPTDDLETKKKKLVEIINAQNGPVFSKWFVKNFPDPQSWFMARMAFVRSTAVMSMMGYIIGLGDRHLENINVDTSTGQTFHVDMNILFNKGELLTVPEVVPFRLTHNIVDAFGPVGVEGPFRIACEIALGVMRKEKDVLMSTLTPFVCDPLLDWVKESKSAGESGGDIGQGHLQRVQDRLTGIVTGRLEKDKAKEKERKNRQVASHALSVSGQVDHVINEARDHNNLAVMYWGWAPYL